MKLVTYLDLNKQPRAGVVHNDYIIDIKLASGGTLPSNMLTLIKEQDRFHTELNLLASCPQPESWVFSVPLAEANLLAPLPKPSSLRDFYAFEQHVRTARANRGLPVPPEWYEIPVFYFSNHQAIIGPDALVERPPGCEKLDFELEIACVIGREGRDIKADQAEDYIFGYCILNDWSARDIQGVETKVGLGPAKGKDFATSLGPYLVTKDELQSYRTGDRYDLAMTADVNGRMVSQGNYKDIHYTFAQMIERASSGTTLYPGDVIGSGTVGSGCILELGPETQPWLRSGDVIELTVTGLGTLRNTIR